MAPNPVKDVLLVGVDNDGSSSFYWEIIDMNGRSVLKSSGKTLVSEEKINVSSLDPGMYFIHFSGENLNVARRFIKINE
jgi:hypothetical protein